MDSEDSDPAERLSGLVSVFAGREGGFVVRRRNGTQTYEYMSQPTNSREGCSTQIKDQPILYSYSNATVALGHRRINAEATLLQRLRSHVQSRHFLRTVGISTSWLIVLYII